MSQSPLKTILHEDPDKEQFWVEVLWDNEWRKFCEPTSLPEALILAGSISLSISDEFIRLFSSSGRIL